METLQTDQSETLTIVWGASNNGSRAFGRGHGAVEPFGSAFGRIIRVNSDPALSFRRIPYVVCKGWTSGSIGDLISTHPQLRAM